MWHIQIFFLLKTEVSSLQEEFRCHLLKFFFFILLWKINYNLVEETEMTQLIAGSEWDLWERGGNPQRRCEFIITVTCRQYFCVCSHTVILTVAILDSGWDTSTQRVYKPLWESWSETMNSWWPFAYVGGINCIIFRRTEEHGERHRICQKNSGSKS